MANIKLVYLFFNYKQENYILQPNYTKKKDMQLQEKSEVDQMDFLKKEDGRICPVKMILFAGAVSLLFTVAGMFVGSLFEKK